MPDQPTPMGMNRTGAGLAPKLSKEMTEGAERLGPPSASPEALELVAEMARVRADYANDAEPIGSMPPPSSLKGAAKAAKDVMKLANPNVLLDKLGERLAFERTGTRLYDAFLHKLEASGEKDVPVNEVRDIRSNEMQHHELIRRVITELGADPTVVTPCADMAGVESMGLVQVLTDPRTNVTQALGAILIAELADNAGWDVLAKLAEGTGHTDAAAAFRQAEAEEQVHLTKVKTWLERRILAEANARP
jgi:rubrerythrin